MELLIDITRKSFPHPSPVRPSHHRNRSCSPLIYGYLRVTDDLDDHEIHRMERGLHLLTQTNGFCYATTFHEDQPGYHGAFDELTRELQRTHAHHVVVPSLEHLSSHPLLRATMLTRLAHDADTHVWAVAP